MDAHFSKFLEPYFPHFYLLFPIFLIFPGIYRKLKIIAKITILVHETVFDSCVHTLPYVQINNSVRFLIVKQIG